MSKACSKVSCQPVPLSAQPRSLGSFAEQPDMLFLRWIDVLCFPSNKSDPGHVCFGAGYEGLLPAWTARRCLVSLSFSIAWFVGQSGPPLSLKCPHLVWKVGWWGNHPLDLTIILCSLPIFHLDPLRISSLADNKLRHTKEGLWPSSASMNEHLGKYRALYSRKKREWVPVTGLHACLASIAWLKAWMSLKAHTSPIFWCAQFVPIYPMYSCPYLNFQALLFKTYVTRSD